MHRLARLSVGEFQLLVQANLAAVTRVVTRLALGLPCLVYSERPGNVNGV